MTYISQTLLSLNIREGYLSIKLFSNLSAAIKCLTHDKAFKPSLKYYLLNYSYSADDFTSTETLSMHFYVKEDISVLLSKFVNCMYINQGMW
jgi:hypothetical protein